MITQVKQFFPLLALVCLTSLFTGCKKDLSDKIVGEWEVSSWKEDGDEFIGSGIDKITMEYEELDGDEGDFSWDFTGGGFTETIDGTYEVDAEDGEITLSVTGGDRITLEATVDGDELELEGTIDGSNIVIKADRE